MLARCAIMLGVMTEEQFSAAVEEMRGIVRRGGRTIDESEFVSWGCESVDEARRLVCAFVKKERESGSGWLVSEKEPLLRKDGKRRKGERRKWRVSVDWAYKGGKG